MRQGWELLLAEAEELRGARAGPLRAYSEYMPAPRLGWKPCGEPDRGPRSPSDASRWCVSEYEEALQLAPGLDRIAKHVTRELLQLMRGAPSQFSRRLLDGNPAWPPEIAAAPAVAHDCVVALPLALSCTQDDKGRVRWTLFGSSHDGPERAFWRSFAARGAGLPAFRRFLAWALGESALERADLRRAGIRVVPSSPDLQFPRWSEERPPAFASALAWRDGDAVDGVRAVVTFRPFAELPTAIRDAYRRGALRLLPSPASLVFWNGRGYRALARELRHAMQVPLLTLFERSEHLHGVRIPQSGWLDEVPARRPDSQVAPHHVRRSHRHEPLGREIEDILGAREGVEVQDDPVTIALFSTAPEVLGLYQKPLARNAQVWTDDYRLVLDGPAAAIAEVAAAAAACTRVGRFGYRFSFPPMRVGEREVFWHRPLVARSGGDGAVERYSAPLLGYLTAERDGVTPVELGPELLDRPGHRDTLDQFEHDPVHRHVTQRNLRKLLEWRELLGKRLTPSLARSLVSASRRLDFDEWLARLPEVAREPRRARRLVARVRESLRAEPRVDPGRAATFAATHGRGFEEAYWGHVAELSDGRFALSNNADLIDPGAGGPAPAGSAPSPRRRQLEEVVGHLHRHYEALFQRHGMAGRAVCADLVFRWDTDFDFAWWGGWRQDRDGQGDERDVVVVIPGCDRSQAVVMGDHYDTAYMEDRYERAKGGDGSRVAASGADDNHSATATLMMAAEALLPLARDGRLARDIWLVHLTGEEFPADCLGSRALVQRLVERRLVLTAADGRSLDLSATRVVAAFILDMVAHNNDRERNVFQISPGDGAASARLAELVHWANLRWNAAAQAWNAAPERCGAGPGRRVRAGESIPPVAEHPRLEGQIRPAWDPRSTLYNTDGQIYSDAGVPVVLLMEDYDLNRKGYHDSADTMANIDLDYGAALAAIAIESVAQAAGVTVATADRSGTPRPRRPLSRAKTKAGPRKPARRVESGA